MAPVPTMRVHFMGTDDPDPVIINTSDFNPERHIPLPDEAGAEVGGETAGTGAQTATVPPPADAEPPPGDQSTAAVKGIGPSTARSLELAGVATIAQLAALSDVDVVDLDVEANVRTRILEDWRAQARAMVEAGGDE